MISSIFCEGLERSREARTSAETARVFDKAVLYILTEQPNEDGRISQDSEADDQGLFLLSQGDGEEATESHSRYGRFETAYHRRAPAQVATKMRTETVERIDCTHW